MDYFGLLGDVFPEPWRTSLFLSVLVRYGSLSESKSIPIGPKVTLPKLEIKSSLKIVLWDCWPFKAGKCAADALLVIEKNTSCPKC